MEQESVAPRAELENRVSELEEVVASYEERIANLEALVGGRNKSAPLKRNMTDADARAVLTGEFKDMPHKEAAAAAGLTYAQVYSCRLEFTFKEVHKDLRSAKFANPWAKKVGRH